LTYKTKEDDYNLTIHTGIEINTVIILHAIAELKDIITDKKLSPDPRFDQLAEQIDELKYEIKRMKSENEKPILSLENSKD